MNYSLIPETAAAFILVFARVGTLVMLLPGIGERFINVRARLSFALLLTLVMLPGVQQTLPITRLMTNTPAMIGLLMSEIAIGLIIGFCSRMIVAALQTAGTIIAQEIGLSASLTMDPSLGTQNVSIGNFLVIMGVTMVFVTDLHHLAIVAIHDSYIMLPAGGMPPLENFMMLALRAVGRGFRLAVQIAAPFIVFGLLFNLGLGVLSRLMPQMQVFFLAAPAIIMIGMLILMATVGVMMGAYITELRDMLGTFVRR
jgi:flagellar biosynthesis protein FliR